MNTHAGSRSHGRAEDIELLAGLWRRWQFAGWRISHRHWSAGALDGWTVHDLYAHVCQSVYVTAEIAGTAHPGSEPDLSDAAAYFAALNLHGPHSSCDVAAAARQWAAGHPVEALVDDFGSHATRVACAVHDHAGALAHTPAGTIRLADYVLVQVVEATVHLLDLDAAVAGMPAPPERALQRTVDVLADLTPSVELIRIATGRHTHPVFPILS